MAVFASDGTALSPRGPLRVVSLGRQEASPVQLLVSNEGVAPARISLSLRADPPAAAEPAQSPGAPETPREAPSPGINPPPERPPAAERPASPPPPAAGGAGSATPPPPPTGPATPPPPVEP